MLACGSISAQSIDDRLSEETFLETLSEYRLPEVLEHYIEAHPSADPVQQRIYEMTADRMNVVAPEISTGERLRLIEDLIAKRREIIEANPYDPRLAILLADQASDLFFLLYPLDATGPTVEFGLPSPEQRSRAERVAREMKQYASEAELAISEAILNIESEPGYTEDMALQLKRRRLARNERDRRIPFLHGIGAYLNAEFNVSDESERQSEHQLAADLLLPLARELEGSLRSRARLYAGFALVRLGRFDEAAALFDAVAADQSAEPLDLFAARLGAARARSEGSDFSAQLDAIERSYESPDGVFFRMLIADQRFMHLRAMAASEPEGESRDRAMVAAFAAYTDLLDADLGVPRDTVRAIVFRKLANAADDEIPLEHLPPIVAIARAENLARVEATRAEAIELFRQSLQRPNLDALSRASALFGLARAHYAGQDWLEAARRFDQLAREHPLDSQAERAIGAAAAILLDLREKAPELSEVSTQLQETLALLLHNYINLPDIDRWRYEAARFDLDEGRLEEARGRLTAIPPGTPLWLDSRFLLVRISRAEASKADLVAPAMHEAMIEEIGAARTAIERGVRETTDAARVRALERHLAQLDLYEAESHLALDRPEQAISRLAGLIDRTDLDQAILGEAVSLRIKALQTAGRADEAQREIEMLMQRMPERATAVIRSRIDTVRAEVESLHARGLSEQAKARADSELVPLAHMLGTWALTAPLSEEDRTAVNLAVADAYRFAQMFGDALPLYERVLAVRSSAMQAIVGRAECLFGLKRYADAMSDYKRLSAARQEVRDSVYWRSELRMLQILDQADTDERQKRQIYPRIERLRTIDPDFGGDEFRPRFNELANKYR